ncbi:hypothetical protein DFH27DRAFT_522702 [Peziza echinospora]|nr:hypothetical protein DFH27DRAFT_522702 [Peziza echinospora]
MYAAKNLELTRIRIYTFLTDRFERLCTNHNLDPKTISWRYLEIIRKVVPARIYFRHLLFSTGTYMLEFNISVYPVDVSLSGSIILCHQKAVYYSEKLFTASYISMEYSHLENSSRSIYGYRARVPTRTLTPKYPYSSTLPRIMKNKKLNSNIINNGALFGDWSGPPPVHPGPPHRSRTFIHRLDVYLVHRGIWKQKQEQISLGMHDLKLSSCQRPPAGSPRTCDEQKPHLLQYTCLGRYTRKIVITIMIMTDRRTPWLPASVPAMGVVAMFLVRSNKEQQQQQQQQRHNPPTPPSPSSNRNRN